MINMLSKKKRDTMLSAAFAGANPSPESPVSLGVPLQMNQDNPSGRVHFTLANISHRWLVPNNASYEAYRTSTSTYVKGFSQTYTIIPNSSTCWWHRRIMFASKKLYGGNDDLAAAIGVQQYPNATTNLPMRDLGNITEGPYNDLRNDVLEDLFAGTGGIDWVSPFRAKTDKRIVTVISDRSFNYSSSNEVSKPRVIRMYDAINKSLVYADEQNGLSMDPSPASVDTKVGVGNIYVLDFYFSPAPDDPEDSLTVSSQSTYYWHEK